MMVNYSRLFGAVLLVLVLHVSPVSAQDDPAVGGWRLQSIQSLEEIVGEEIRFRNATMSADGSTLAWDSPDEVCVHRLNTGETNCFAWFEGGIGSGRYNLPVLSPDGSYLAFHEDFIIRVYESDIWTLNTENGEFINHTDDGAEDSPIMNADQGPTPLDYLPSWNPADGHLYFFRSERQSDQGFSLGLYRLPDLERGTEPELVRDFTPDQAEMFSVFLPVAWSPDGSRLAFTMVPRQMLGNPDSGLFVYQMAAGLLGIDQLEQIATLDDLLVAGRQEPEEEGTPYYPISLHWAADQIVMNVMPRPDRRQSSNNALVFDLASGDVVPVFDMNTVKAGTETLQGSSYGQTPSFEMPWLGAVSPDGSVFWYVTRDLVSFENGLWAMPLPPGSGDPVLLETFTPEIRITDEHYPVVSVDGKLLVQGTLFTFSRE